MQVTPIEVWDLLDLLGLPPGWDELSFVTSTRRRIRILSLISSFAEKFRKRKRTSERLDSVAGSCPAAALRREDARCLARRSIDWSQTT
jgi:hypothetical protein